MTTTGTYAFNPSAADIILNAFGMIGVRRPEITQQHLEDASIQANMLMVDFSNRNPNRWGMETKTQILDEVTPTYTLDAEVLAISIAYLETTSGGTTTSRVLGPISATDYAAIPQKLNQATPTSYFFSLLTPNPTITIWPVVPSGSSAVYTLKMQTFRQMQDVRIGGGVTIDTPYRFLDAFSTGMAARLAVIYPEKLKMSIADLDALFEKRFKLAAQLDQERTPMYVRCQMSGYFR